MIKPALDSLNQYIPIYQQQFGDTQQGIQNNQQSQTQGLQSSLQGSANTINAEGQRQDTAAENAKQEAARQYAEITQGIQSRYGGTTPTGGFAEAIAGRQAQVNSAHIQQGLQQAHLELSNRLTQVQETGRIALKDIENNAQDQLNKARGQLDTNLADIRRDQGTLQTQKATLAMTSMQHFQDTVNQINSQNASFKQNLILQQQQAESQLKIAQQYAQRYSSGLGAGSGFGLTGQQFQPQTTPLSLNSANPQTNQANTGGAMPLSLLPDDQKKRLTAFGSLPNGMS